MSKKYKYLVCGWLAPDGEFTECGHEEHRYVAKTVFKCDERTLEEKEGLKMVEDIENRLLKIKPQDWAEIEKW